MIGVAFREASVVEDELGVRTLFHENESNERPGAFGPVCHSPRLDDAFIAHEFKVPPDYEAIEELERAPWFGGDLRWHVSLRHARLDGGAEERDLLELFGVGERIINARAASFEDGLLMDRFLSMRNFLAACTKALLEAKPKLPRAKV